MGQHLGVVAKLWRYPVKSMRGEECEQIELNARGVDGCRMTTLAQADLPSAPKVLAAILCDADLTFGVYADVVVPGTIARNDCCTLLP